jgi:Tfp pilus assembly protein FimV
MVAASSGVVQVPRRSSAEEELEARVASLQASNSQLESRLQQAERELADLRSAPKGRPEQTAFAGVATAPLVVLPSEALGAAALPLRFSSIPPALRTGRRRALRWAVTMSLMLVVVAFVAITVLSRAH